MSNLNPIVICHPACSGGSLIFRLVVSQFGMAGMSEIAHQHTLPPDAFLPTDPEHSLLVSGVIDKATFADIFLQRLVNAVSICRQKNLRPLIREHTHSYFFTADFDGCRPVGPSWIANEYRRRFGQVLKCIVSVRDPIDSWLGLELSFPTVTPPSFEQYVSYYSSFIDHYEQLRDSNLAMLVRYEDMLDDPATELGRIAEFIEAPFTGELAGDWRRIPSSGNSGRQSDVLKPRPRRPFDIHFFDQVRNSSQYGALADRLGYPHLENCTTSREIWSARLLPLERLSRFGLGKPIHLIRRWLLPGSLDAQ